VKQVATRVHGGLSPAALGTGLVVASVASFLFSTAGSGQTPPPPRGAYNPDSAFAETLRRLEGEPIRIEDAVALALENATDVQAAEAAYVSAEGSYQIERGAFDPELFGQVGASHQENPSTSPFVRPGVLENELTTATGGARVTLPLGTELEASVATHKLDTNSLYTSINPSYGADGTISVRQPLLNGFGPGTSAPKTAAARRRDSAASGAEDVRRRARADVETVYWQLYASERNVVVQRLLVEQAQALLEQARVRASAGLVGPNDVANARVFLSQQQLIELDQEEFRSRLSDHLATLTGVRPMTSDHYRSASEPAAEVDFGGLDSLLTRASRSNPALRAAEENLRGMEALATGAGWNQLPTLDLVGAVGGIGLTGTTLVDSLPVDLAGNYGDAIGDAVSRRFPNWSVGLELTLPIFRDEGRGERRQYLAEVERARAQVAGVGRDLEERVRASYRELMNGRQRLTIAREGFQASLDQVRIGRIEFDNGRTTAFELVRLASDLGTAQQRLSQALVRAETAAAELRYLTGETPVAQTQE